MGTSCVDKPSKSLERARPPRRSQNYIRQVVFPFHGGTLVRRCSGSADTTGAIIISSPTASKWCPIAGIRQSKVVVQSREQLSNPEIADSQRGTFYRTRYSAKSSAYLDHDWCVAVGQNEMFRICSGAFGKELHGWHFDRLRSGKISIRVGYPEWRKLKLNFINRSQQLTAGREHLRTG